MPVWRYPIVGVTDWMTSPSSSSTRRSTPCVLGCCGPMLTVIVSVRISAMAANLLLDDVAHGVTQRAMHLLNACRHDTYAFPGASARAALSLVQFTSHLFLVSY